MTFNLYPIGPRQPHCPQSSFKGQFSFKPQARSSWYSLLGLCSSHEVDIMPSIPHGFKNQKQQYELHGC